MNQFRPADGLKSPKKILVGDILQEKSDFFEKIRGRGYKFREVEERQWNIVAGEGVEQRVEVLRQDGFLLIWPSDAPAFDAQERARCQDFVASFARHCPAAFRRGKKIADRYDGVIDDDVPVLENRFQVLAERGAFDDVGSVPIFCKVPFHARVAVFLHFFKWIGKARVQSKFREQLD